MRPHPESPRGFQLRLFGPDRLPGWLVLLIVLTLFPGVARAHDGGIILLWFVFSSLFLGVLGAIAIAVTGLVLARRRRADPRPGGGTVARRALLGGLLGFPLGSAALWCCAAVGMTVTSNHPGQGVILLVMAGALVLQVGYVVLIGRWMAR